MSYNKEPKVDQPKAFREVTCLAISSHELLKTPPAEGGGLHGLGFRVGRVSGFNLGPQTKPLLRLAL